MDFSSPPSITEELPFLDSSSSVTGLDDPEHLLTTPIGFDNYSYNYNLDPAAGLKFVNPADLQRQDTSQLGQDANLHDYGDQFFDEIGYLPNKYPAHINIDGDSTRAYQEDGSFFSEPQRSRRLDHNLEIPTTIPIQHVSSEPWTANIKPRPTAEKTQDLCTQFGLPLHSLDPHRLPSSSPPRSLPLPPSSPSQQSTSSNVTTCPTCGKTTKRSSDMPRHRDTHGPDRFKCNFRGCRLRFKRQDKAREHCRKNHGDGHGENDFSAIPSN